MISVSDLRFSYPGGDFELNVASLHVDDPDPLLAELAAKLLLDVCQLIALGPMLNSITGLPLKRVPSDIILRQVSA